MTVNAARETKGWRTRVPVLLVVAACVAGVTAAVTGAASPINPVQFLPPGHWVFNVALSTAFHVDGATSDIDASVLLNDDQGSSQVVQGDTSGYVVGSDRITVFGKSSLEVVDSTTPPVAEVPVSLEVAGGPYLVYREAGVVVRLGEHPKTIPAGKGLGIPVATSDGTVWLTRPQAGLICQLPSGADRVSCPVLVGKGHKGALTVVDDRAMFVDTTSDQLHPIEADGLGQGRALGVDVPDSARVASSDVAGRVAILDPDSNQMHLVDPAGESPRSPVKVALQDGDYDGPVSTGSVVAVMDRATDTVTTYDSRGERRSSETLPKEAGDPRLTRGEDHRIYVDGAEGEHVLVVDHDGSVTGVPVGDTGRAGDNPAHNSPDAPAREPEHKADPPVEKQKDQRPPEQGPQVRDTPVQDPAGEQRQPDQSQPPQPPPPVPATPPGAPPGVSASPGNAAAVVRWGAAADNRAPITGYTVSWAGGARSFPGGARSATITGLANGTAYAFTVSATNAKGTGPGASTGPVTPAAPRPPARLALSRGPATSQYCSPPNCAWMHVVLTGFAPNTSYLLVPHSSDPGYSNGGATLTTDGNGRLAADRFAYAGVGHTVWVGVQTPNGLVRSNNLVWEGTKPVVTVSRGADSSSAACAAPDCAWLHVVMNGFAPNTQYTITGYGSDWGDFSEPSVMRTDANGAVTFEDIRFDGPGQTVWVVVDTPDGPVESNHFYWEPR
ncbi:fibronectin type III domain-containing protein [Actinophytocola sp.]|uniref:fibronectin type III domain-containing protein n=1 Tax=Actinophytocola sp. TaxID=1872138 RepID=UPI002EDB3073